MVIVKSVDKNNKSCHSKEYKDPIALNDMTKLRNVILISTSQNPASISQAHSPSQKQNHGKV